MPECRRCGIKLKWNIPYNKGDRPVNQDGSTHDCGLDPMKKKKIFRYESKRMSTFNIPENAHVGKFRCKACIYNKHTWCDNGKTKPCLANI